MTMSLIHCLPTNMSQANKLMSDFAAPRKRSPCVVKSRMGAGDDEKIQLPDGLKQELMPKHVAVIVDGNRRWAINRGLTPTDGYKVGTNVLKQLAITCSNYGIKVVSCFAFSTENWRRPQEEVDFLMNLAGDNIVTHLREAILEENIQISYIGNRSRLPESLQEKMSESEELGKSNTGTHLVIAFNYSGQYDIVEATKKIATKVKDGVFEAEEIDPSLFEKHLETNTLPFPNPDLLIRTSGSLRISNFMLWQLAYTELYFTDKMFPDIDDTDLVQALAEYQRRPRRFGGNS